MKKPDLKEFKVYTASFIKKNSGTWKPAQSAFKE